MKPLPEYIDRGGGKLAINPRPALLQRHPCNKSAEQALDELHQKLAISTVIYERHGDAGRIGAAQALREVIDYLSGQGLPIPALLPLFDLAEGLNELDRRVVVPLLVPKNGPGRPPKASVDARTDAFLAIVMECCVRHFRDERGMRDFLEPAKQLAEKLVKQSALNIDVTKSRMEDVREDVTAKPKSELARSLFNTFMSDADDAPCKLTWVRNFIGTGWIPAPEVSG